MARLGEKMKNAKKYHSGKKTAWEGNKVAPDSPDRCKGCQVKYKDMSAGQFNRHLKALNKGEDDCPDV